MSDTQLIKTVFGSLDYYV